MQDTNSPLHTPARHRLARHRLARHRLVCVVAMSENRVIGDGTDLIWHLPGDLKRVKALTMGCPLIMGRTTFESIGRALPGRLNIVLTRNENWTAENVITAHSLRHSIELASRWLDEQDNEENRIILFGGGQIYQLGLQYCDIIEATIVEDKSQSGVMFPEFNPQDFDDELIQRIEASDGHPAFRYHKLTRRRIDDNPALVALKSE